MLIAKSSLVDLFFFCRQLVSTQLRGGLGVLVHDVTRKPESPSPTMSCSRLCLVHASTSAFDNLSFHVTPIIFLTTENYSTFL